MVEIQEAGAVGEWRVGRPAECGGDGLGADPVLLQHGTDRVGLHQLHTDGVMIEAGHAFEGMAQGQMADVMQQRRDPQ